MKKGACIGHGPAAVCRGRLNATCSAAPLLLQQGCPAHACPPPIHAFPRGLLSAIQCIAPTMGASAALIRAPCWALIIEPSTSTKRASCTPVTMYCQPASGTHAGDPLLGEQLQAVAI